MEKDVEKMFEKCFAYINAIIALAEKNSTLTEEEDAVKILAIDLSNRLTEIEEKMS